MIAQQVIHSDLRNVAQNHDLTEEEVWSLVQYVSSKKLTIDLRPLKRLGIDEISLGKGQQDFIVVLVDLDRHAPVGFVSSRKHKDIKNVLSDWGSEVLGQIVEVSIDCSDSYRGLVRKMMPNADIVADCFHVMKPVNDD